MIDKRDQKISPRSGATAKSKKSNRSGSPISAVALLVTVIGASPMREPHWCTVKVQSVCEHPRLLCQLSIHTGVEKSDGHCKRLSHHPRQREALQGFLFDRAVFAHICRMCHCSFVPLSCAVSQQYLFLLTLPKRPGPSWYVYFHRAKAHRCPQFSRHRQNAPPSADTHQRRQWCVPVRSLHPTPQPEHSVMFPGDKCIMRKINRALGTCRCEGLLKRRYETGLQCCQPIRGKHQGTGQMRYRIRRDDTGLGPVRCRVHGQKASTRD